MTSRSPAEQLRELAAAATPGPWRVNAHPNEDGVFAGVPTMLPDEDGIQSQLVAWCHSDFRDRADAAYIARLSPDLASALADLWDAAQKAETMSYPSLDLHNALVRLNAIWVASDERS